MTGREKLTKARREEFIVIFQQALMSGGLYGIAYSWDGERFGKRHLAIEHGLRTRGSDDFNIGRAVGNHLTWFGWMNEQIDEPREVMIGIASQIGLKFDASRTALKERPHGK